MKAKIQQILQKQSFFPSWIGLFINPFYFARAGLAKAMIRYANSLQGSLLDVGCGSMPYKPLFNVSEYIGLDIDNENSRKRAVADEFYDGKMFPFRDNRFDAVLCNQVLEHVFNPDEFLNEIHRVMKPGAKLLLTVPFVWDEHEQPFDFGRYTSFGLKTLFERSGLKVIKHEKLGADPSILFQLTNAYLYKISKNWNKYLRIIFTVTVMAFVNITGVIVSLVLPKNPDLFLDHIVLVEKLS